jgi:hypothetical protein
VFARRPGPADLDQESRALAAACRVTPESELGTLRDEGEGLAQPPAADQDVDHHTGLDHLQHPHTRGYGILGVAISIEQLGLTVDDPDLAFGDG